MLWAVELDVLTEIACDVAGRNLTNEEWERYLGDEPYHETCPGP
jgi:hypothetical protein